MFLKNLFRKSQEPNPEVKSQTKTQNKNQMPAGHPKVGPNGSAAQCPFANKKQEEEMPRGGCPFMGGNDSQKNPPLQLSNQNFDEPFVSKYRYFLSDSKIDFDFFQTHKRNRDRSRQVFNQYPIYLQHTLFFNSEDYKAVRELQCCSRFMAYEDLREKGNKQFNAKNFARSLDYYQRAYSIFKWLDHEQPQIQIQSSCHSLAQIDSSMDQQNNSRIQYNIDSQTEKQIPKKGGDDEFRKQHKQFFVLYCDENTKLYDGKQMTQTYDTDMRKSLMVQILLNLAASYIMLNHYSLAYTCCVQAEELTDKMSQIQFRKAQSLVFNKNASLSQLQEAKQVIGLALKKKPQQKIFNQTNPSILKMLNLHDAEEAYTKCLQKIQQKIVVINQATLQIQKRVFARAAQIHEAQLDIIARGMQPHQRMIQTDLKDTVQFRVLQRIKQKYLKVIDFYTQSQKPEQVRVAKIQLQQILRIQFQMYSIAGVSIQQCPQQQDLGDRSSDKILKRLQKVKFQQAQQIYNRGRYNFQVLEWAIKEIVQEDHKKRQLQKQAQANSGSQQFVKTQSKAKYLWLLLILPILTILINRFLLH